MTRSIEWKTMVKNAIEKQNRDRLLQDCHKCVDGQLTRKTKTSSIVPNIEDTNYRRQPLDILQQLTKQETKILMMARYGMLECGQNFKGTLSELCSKCQCTDDEEHRLNFCPKYGVNNFSKEPLKIRFDTVYSNNVNDVKLITSRIAEVWDVLNGHGSMIKS